MQIKEETHGAGTVMVPDSALAQDDADQFKARLAEALSESAGRLVVDLSSVPFIDSRGLEALADANDALAAGGGTNGEAGIVAAYDMAEGAFRTDGTNIYGVLAVRRVDPLRIVSSSIGDTAKVFGLAAARAAIVREIRNFMSSNAPNARHLGLIADEMTMTGRITSIERGGIDVRERDNVLLRMSMAAPTQVLQKAAVAGTAGRVYGAAPALALGRPPTLGTTWNEFSMDEDFVRENVQSVDSVFDDL